MDNCDRRPRPQNNPAAFNELSFEARFRLICHCLARFEPAKSTHHRSAYSLKHDLEHLGGLYTYNGQFVGALICAGFMPADPPGGPVVRFRIKLRPDWRRAERARYSQARGRGGRISARKAV